ncbi:hypothetical protein C922_03640 [Plasmodium inui San Antonio 1]|uniref:Mitochondrial import inner membrane translocase subunit n=1 Tax=Plasmodium inui San Antonio 1 TaxID=1237626 RepID=W7AKQ9_9APIC|nr:hypothetical protein C922_03640 [Plasmodium inui San Antonio 1]EUD65916.1 hypothetical protein C922_03640 [Plasmodium inui San Antonio 1]
MDDDTKDDSNLNNFVSQLNTLNKRFVIKCFITEPSLSHYLFTVSSFPPSEQLISSFKETCKISSYCFDKCVSYPEKSLSNTNKKCIWNCTQRYVECDYFIKNRSKDNSELSKVNILDGVKNSTMLTKGKDKSTSL